MGLFSKKNKVETGMDPAQPGADESVKQVHRRGTLIVYFENSKKAVAGWRWRLVAPNGKITADSGESYIRRFDAKVAALRLADVAADAVLEVRDR